MHSLGFGTPERVSSIEFLRATAFHNVAVLEEALCLRIFVQGPDMHKLSTKPDGIRKASDSIITAAIRFAEWIVLQWGTSPKALFESMRCARAERRYTQADRIKEARIVLDVAVDKTDLRLAEYLRILHAPGVSSIIALNTRLGQMDICFIR